MGEGIRVAPVPSPKGWAFDGQGWATGRPKTVEACEAAFRDLLPRLDGLHYVFAFGTALWLYRDKQFRKPYEDVDVAVIAPADEFTARVADWPWAVKQWSDAGLAQLSCSAPSGLRLDVHFYEDRGSFLRAWLRSDRYFMLPPAALLYPEFLDTPYGRVAVPGGIERYLEAQYGPRWRQPSGDKAICYHIDGRVGQWNTL